MCSSQTQTGRFAKVKKAGQSLQSRTLSHHQNQQQGRINLICSYLGWTGCPLSLIHALKELSEINCCKIVLEKCISSTALSYQMLECCGCSSMVVPFHTACGDLGQILGRKEEAPVTGLAFKSKIETFAKTNYLCLFPKDFASPLHIPSMLTPNL